MNVERRTSNIELRSKLFVRRWAFGVRCSVFFPALSAVLFSVIFLDLGAAPAFAQAPTAPAPKGIGPLTIISKRGPLTVYLLRREKDLIWVNQRSQSGGYIETGVAVKDIQKFEFPRPRVFQMAEAAATPEQVEQARQLLGKFIEQLASFRDLPGMTVDEAKLELGRLEEKEEKWEKAAGLYEDILSQKYDSAPKDAARLRLGLCQVQRGQNEKALENLNLEILTDDDLQLLSQVYFARGEAFARLGKNDEAIQNYLYLVVFDPFVDRNEARCLAAVLPCYAAITDWEAAGKTAQTLVSRYPGSEEAGHAEEFLAQHKANLSQQAGLTQTYDASEMKEDKGVYDEFK